MAAITILDPSVPVGTYDASLHWHRGEEFQIRRPKDLGV